jgi:PAS domain-containing protein
VVQAYGEMVDVLWRDDECDAAIRLEELWNELAATHRFDLFCGYAMNGFSKEAHQSQFKSICESHTAVYPTEAYTTLDEEEQALEISSLQQRSLALKTELQRRKQTEADLLFLKAIVQSADDAIVSKTLAGIVTSWNPGAERLLVIPRLR